MKHKTFNLPIIFAMIFCLTACSFGNPIIMLSPTDRSTFFGVTHTLKHQPNEQEKEIAQSIISTAKTAFEALDENQVPENAGELSKYFSNASKEYNSIDAKIDLVTAKFGTSNGYIWVRYSVVRHYTDSYDTSGSENVLSYWIVKNVSGNWVVTKIKESP